MPHPNQDSSHDPVCGKMSLNVEITKSAMESVSNLQQCMWKCIPDQDVSNMSLQGMSQALPSIRGCLKPCIQDLAKSATHDSGGSSCD